MSILLFFILFQLNNLDLNDKDEIIKQIEQSRSYKTFSLEFRHSAYNQEPENYKIYFLENKKDSLFPDLYSHNKKENSTSIIKDYKHYKYQNDTLFLDTVKYHALNSIYSSVHTIFYPLENFYVRSLQFKYDLGILKKFYNDLKITNNKDYKYLKDSVYRDNDSLIIDLKYEVLKKQPYYINVVGRFIFKYDKSFNLINYYEDQYHVNQIGERGDSSMRSINIFSYDFTTPDTSLFNTDRPYKVLVNVDSVRKAKQAVFDKIKKSPTKLPDRFNLVDNKEVDITKQKDIKVYNFWGSWCGFCYLSYPSIQKISDEFGNKVEVIGWGAMERDTSRIMPYIKKKKINFPYILGADTLAIKLEVKSFPTTLIFKGQELYYKTKYNNDSLYFEIKEKLNELGVK